MAPRPRAIALAAGILAAGLARAGSLTPQEEAGRKIYLDGESATGSVITAVVDGTAVPASVLPCAGCHGDDGLGRPEGTVVPPDIRWSMLVKPYGRKTGSGRRHPPYDERRLARAIESGLDAAGAPLDATMPRYAMSRADMEGLVAFLKKLEHERDPGVFPARIRLGTVLPTAGRLAGIGEVVRQVLQGWFSELDGTGAIHGRTIELAVAGYDSDREDGLRAARELLAGGDVFALVAPFTPRAEAELARLAEDRKVPVVGPLASSRAGGGATDRYVFQVLSGVREQARVLADHAASLGLSRLPAAILRTPEEPLAEAAAGARAQLEAHGWKDVELRTLEPGQPLPPLASDLRARGIEVVLLLGGDEELAALGRAARELDWAPVLVAPGGLAARGALGLPPTLDGKVFLAFPTAPADAASAAAAPLARLQERAHVPRRHLAAQVEACAAAAIATEGLKRTGRALRRERFVENLEALYQFQTGLVPPVTYGPNRRVGALGAYVVGVDLKTRSFRRAGRWSSLE
ncbi:MAG TPA: ABC transporter substrate-binding protein [Anaeromyxobacteraceae bacterium]|nr:ABC transporter substrate-binding protein [Anaeromyxobacteraceae bacterium]